MIETAKVPWVNYGDSPDPKQPLVEVTVLDGEFNINSIEKVEISLLTSGSGRGFQFDDRSRLRLIDGNSVGCDDYPVWVWNELNKENTP